MLDCQKLIRTRKLVSHGQIPENFVPEEPNETKDIENESNADYVTWVMVRYVTKTNLPEYSSCEKPTIPSFTATYSVLIHKHCPLTRIGFTPIIPYLATEYDTHAWEISKTSSLKKGLNIIMVRGGGLQNSKGATTFESRRIWKHFSWARMISCWKDTDCMHW